MTLDQNNYNGLMLKLFEALNNNHSGGIRSLLEGILNATMKLERENAIQTLKDVAVELCIKMNTLIRF
jgi:hypothetical protein